VTFDPGDTIGAGSPGGTFVNAASGAPLGLGVPTTLGNRSGGGTQLYPETVSIPGATLAAWQRQGVRRIGYRRAFISIASGSTVTGQILLDLAGSTLEDLRDPASGALGVLRMELTFASGKRIEIVERDSALIARLTLSYSGSGTLRGRWQVAEPGGGAEQKRVILLHCQAADGQNHGRLAWSAMCGAAQHPIVDVRIVDHSDAVGEPFVEFGNLIHAARR
jgi:hypothetical protein